MRITGYKEIEWKFENVKNKNKHLLEQQHDTEEENRCIKYDYKCLQETLRITEDHQKQTEKEQTHLIEIQNGRLEMTERELQNSQLVNEQKVQEINFLHKREQDVRHHLSNTEINNFKEEFYDNIFEEEYDTYKKNQFTTMDSVKDSLDNYFKKINKFIGTNTSKEYLHLQEMMSRCLSTLDNMQNLRNDGDLKNKRKQLINEITNLSSLLEKKVNVGEKSLA